MRWKKGQFYILTAMILIVIAFALVQGRGSIPASRSKFTEMTENLATESRIAINQAIYNQENADEAYTRFHSSFMMYARTKDTRFGTAYAVKEGNKITVHNDIGTMISLKENYKDIADKGNVTIKAGDIVTIQYANRAYPLIFNDRDVQVKILAATQNDAEKRVKVIDLS